ncbi:SpoIIE family protein phosphatase [Microscilla marina]|uniref:Serine/threonine protein kinases, putative n=1 Tax=Microscilla marina ATCC 23134 TaxID=313606 RepID=A1ZKL9_MICM2|nr:SpoIIE family protein phosphatase [Microscilla marina]EAY29245.1 serine/threonine protein kinases, putative [Microscilla marina ATCC 23134]
MKITKAIFCIIIGFLGTVTAQTLPNDSWQKTQANGKGTITVLWHDAKPFHYYDEAGKHTGIDHDLMVAMTRFVEAKYKVKLDIQWHKAQTYAEFYNSIKDGTGGIFGAAAFSITPERKKVMRFSPTYMPDIEIIVSHPELPTFNSIGELINSPDFTKYTAVSVKNTTFDKSLVALKNKLAPNLSVKYVTNTHEIVQTINQNPYHFGYIHLPIYALALKNGLRLKRQKLLQIQREGYAVMYPLKSDWGKVIEEFFNSTEFKPLINKVTKQHVGTQVKDLIWDVSAKNNKELALLTKENELQSLRLKKNQLEIEQSKLRLERQAFYQVMLIVGVVIILILGVVLYSRYQIKQRSNQALRDKNTEIKKQRDEIELMHTELKDSISYAQQIQQAMMPHQTRLTQAFPENFVIYRPKEMLSGNFYWLNDRQNLKLLAVADCAGRGVPGAFLTMMGTLMLNHVVRESKRTTPEDALTLMDKLVQRTLTSDAANLAIDISLCCIDYHKKIIKFTGAHSSLFIVNNGRLKQIQGDKHPVGKGLYNAKNPLTMNLIEFEKGDVLYLLTNGFQNQLGGNNGHNKKFMLLRIKDLLVEINSQPLEEQKQRLENELEKWRGQNEQTDDILMLGVQL